MIAFSKKGARMNEKQLKQGLLQLKSEGWLLGDISDDFVDEFLRIEFDAPARDIRERFLTAFRSRIQAAIQAQKIFTDLSREATTVKLGHNNAKVRHTRMGRKQYEK
jgi:hypothetical protein